MQLEELLERLERAVDELTHDRERIVRVERAIGELCHDLHGVVGSERLFVSRGGQHQASAQLLAAHEARLEAAGIAPQTGLPEPKHNPVLPALPGYALEDYERGARTILARAWINDGVPPEEAVRRANSTPIKPPERRVDPEAYLSTDALDPIEARDYGTVDK